MTGKERVLSVFQRRLPDRVPCWCGASIEFWEKAKRELNRDDESLRLRLGDDHRRILPTYRLPEKPLHADATTRTVFGIERRGLGYGQPLQHPLASATLREVEEYPWPDADCVDTSTLRGQAAPFRDEYAILGGDWSPFWHDAIDLLGMEEMYLKMYDHPEVVESVMRHLTDFYVESNRRIFEAAGEDIDIMFIGNDFGSQNGPLLSPALFGRFVLPYLKQLIDIGHDYGLFVQLHCCGGIEPLISPMIDAGLDALHAIQPSCVGMDLSELKRNYGDKIVLNGAVDSHNILIDGPSPEFVKEKTRVVLSIMAPGGGYIAGASHDTILEETPVENVLAMFDAVREFGSYPIR